MIEFKALFFICLLVFQYNCMELSKSSNIQSKTNKASKLCMDIDQALT